LVGISGPGVSASFVYDGLGRRESKTVNGNLTEFLYDGRNPVQETSGATIMANILPGLSIDEFLTRTDVTSGMTSYFLADALASPVAVTDSTGTVQTEYSYEPFGQTTLGGISNSNPYQYTGRENDGTGLFYYRGRYYNPSLQRFISEDPIGFRSGDFNLFAYVFNNPLIFIDPFGFDKCMSLNCDPPPCSTMDCTPKPPAPEPPCRTMAECFGPGRPTTPPCEPGECLPPDNTTAKPYDGNDPCQYCEKMKNDFNPPWDGHSDCQNWGGICRTRPDGTRFIIPYAPGSKIDIKR
jgi:RHS repeat-associated protein